MLLTMSILFGPLLLAHAEPREAGESIPTVQATVETAPVATPGDSADDPAVWIHPVDPSLSLIIATNKEQGLLVYDLHGVELQLLPVGRLNNVDLRRNIPGGGPSGGAIDLIAATNRTDDSIMLFRVDPEARRVEALEPSRFPSGIDGVYGIAMYRNPSTGQAHIFASRDKKQPEHGLVRHWRMEEKQGGGLEPNLLRAIRFESRVEGMVCDDDAGTLYIAEERKGIWAIDIGTDAPPTPRRVAVTRSKGPLVPDVEGLAIFDAGGGDGFLIASSQGDSTYAVYDRRPPNRYILNFRIVDSDLIDGTQETDGIEIVSVPLGPSFPHGVFIAQDGENPGANQNFKVVPWERIGALLPNPKREDAPR